MNDSLGLNSLLDRIAGIMIRCFILGFVFLLIWFLLILAGGDFIYGIHSKLFGISREHFDMMMYAGMGITKMFIFGVFLIPYVSIKLVLAKR